MDRILNSQTFQNLSQEDKNKILQKFEQDEKESITKAGTNIGVNAALSLGQPITQMVLSAFKSDVAAFVLAANVTDLNELLRENPDHQSMRIYLKSGLEPEKYIHKYKYCTLKDLQKNYTLEKSRLVIRLNLQKCYKMRLTPYHVYSMLDLILLTATIPSLIEGIIHIEVSNGNTEDKFDINKYLGIQETEKEEHTFDVPAILRSHLCGIPDIKDAFWEKDCIVTNGSNLTKVMSLPYTDTRNTITDHIYEVIDRLGVEAARYVFVERIHKIAGLGNVFNNKHVNLLADRIFANGDIVTINRYGLSHINAGFLRTISFESGLEQLVDTFNSVTDYLKDPTAKIIAGKLGYGYLRD